MAAAAKSGPMPTLDGYLYQRNDGHMFSCMMLA